LSNLKSPDRKEVTLQLPTLEFCIRTQQSTFIDSFPQKILKWPTVPKKGLNITIHQGNAYQNHNDVFITSHPLNGFHQKDKRYHWQRCTEKGILAHCYGTVNWYSHYAKHCGGSSKN